jgi:hypothetical protein
MIRILLFALLAWFLYNLIFRFILPVYRTSKQMKKKFSEMHQQMQEHMNQQQGFDNNASAQKTPSQKPAGDYIDFEEIK